VGLLLTTNYLLPIEALPQETYRKEVKYMNKYISAGIGILVVCILVWVVVRSLGQSSEFLKKVVVPSQNTSSFPTDTEKQNGSVVPVSGGAFGEKGGVAERTVITYSDAGFAPSSVTVKAGATVTFVNESTRGMWVASDVYPSNDLLPGFDQLGAVAKNGAYEYRFNTIGRWPYHNQVLKTHIGVVIVTK